MKRTVKLISLVLVLLTVLPMLLACQDEGTPNTPNAPTETTLNLVTKSTTQYVIVRDYKASEAEANAVLSIVQAAKTFLGVDFVVKECYSDIDDPSDVVMDYEILVGTTNRPESRVAMSGLRDADSTMQVIGNKLVLGGPGTKGTEKAVMQFLTSFVYEQGDRYGVAAGKPQNLVFSSKDNKTEIGTYSYTTTCEMLGARVDSFGIYYAKDSARSDEFKKFSDAVNEAFLKETGYELGVMKDTSGYADYEVLVGTTERTDAKYYKDLQDHQYYIELVATENGGKLYIVYGKNAFDAALKAVKEQLVPPSKDQIDLKLESGFVLTNK